MVSAKPKQRLVAIGISTYLLMLIAGQALMGASQAGVFPCSVRSYAEWIPEGRRAAACAMSALGMQVGAITAAGLTGYLLGYLAWRWIFLVYAIPCMAWAIAFVVRYRDRYDRGSVDASDDPAPGRVPWRLRCP